MCCYIRIDGVSIVFAAGDNVEEECVVFFSPQAVDRFASHAPVLHHADFGPVVLVVAEKTFISEGWALLLLCFPPQFLQSVIMPDLGPVLCCL